MSEHGKLNKLKRNDPGLMDVGEQLLDLEENKDFKPTDACIPSRVRLPMDKLDEALAFWKPLYFEATTEGRNLNGIEAAQLTKADHKPRPNWEPYLGMCNLMALEYIRIMGDQWPTVEAEEELYKGNEREKLFAGYVKKIFAPTSFQVQWALAIAQAAMTGSEPAIRDLFYQYRDQLNDDLGGA